MSNPEGTLSWQDLVREATARLTEALGGARQQEARWIVERISGYSSGELVVKSGELVGGRSVARFDQLIARRCAGEPLQYVLGQWAFRSLELIVDRRVLIPRPETEMVAGLAIDVLRTRRTPLAADLGTGSGAIALSIANEVAEATIHATDVSSDALAVARANLTGLGRAARRVTMHVGSWYSALPPSLAGRLDLIISNPPYVAASDELPPDVAEWEPRLALIGPGSGGEEFVSHLIDHAPEWLVPDGVLIIEMQPNQTETARLRALKVGFIRAQIIRDFADKPRALVAHQA